MALAARRSLEFATPSAIAMATVRGTASST